MTLNGRQPEFLVPAGALTRRGRVSTSESERAPAPIDVDALCARLKRDIAGEVRFDEGSRGLYAQDASNYFHWPLGLVVPRTVDDVRAAVAACRHFGAPVLSRGGGTALAGQSCNEAVIIDFSKYLNRIVSLSPAERLARVEPGLICDALVHAATPHGLTWGPKPATHTHCCFGGMLANNCGGMQAQYAGIAVENVEGLRALLYDGTELELGWMHESELSERGVDQLRITQPRRQRCSGVRSSARSAGGGRFAAPPAA